MSGISITATLEGIDAVDRQLAKLDPLPAAELLGHLGRMIQEQTRERFETKLAPDGSTWTPNRAGTSTLLRQGHLKRSIDYTVAGETAIIGSGLIYAAIHQNGGVIKAKTKKALMFRIGNQWVTRRSVKIPKRAYLGISAENREDILDQVGRFLRARLG